ncbi:polysaccharide lyase family 4 protein [Aspergillus clavatus NRRL 1]|uniref:rhamnogalacturonan endolyase n=1 Tax=Aspergillus clavatus (strain ATCC 1007 / CBS 513.65 / DSM 816 / NCTC 3887 / NRRL 1 / QM 1276 / 107) TaxID=344612 RepID=A1CNA7_ASPCL|nr:uncharacterized protein ACLA_018320 [Aspergillus clavatus NRRL 1]EAW07128.1 conserved hypothetical protein [Aspergillus clavatus NRRL 1]
MRAAASVSAIPVWFGVALAALQVAEGSSTITLNNDRLKAIWSKNKGSVVDMFLDGHDLLGPQSGSTGIGPYLDCYCTPSGFYTAGSTNPSMEYVKGTDATDTRYAVPTILVSSRSSWNVKFYDSIAKHVVGFVPSSQRGSVNGHVKLPKGATRPIAVLSADGLYFQDNNANPSAYQYWTDIESNGEFSMDHVAAGKCRLTVYADGIFSDYVRDGVEVSAGQTTKINDKWNPESAGEEVWRLGTPDKSSGEFRHGNARDPSHPLHPPEYLIYWGAYDWRSDFPEGVHYTIGSSDLAKDFNTVHWSAFGPTPENPDVEYNTTHDWTIDFSLTKKQLNKCKMATLTIQLAGAKTASGNTDVWNPAEPYNNIILESYINEQTEPLTMLIGFNQSSSCIVRSAVSCYQVRSRMEFPADWLEIGENRLTLHLPYNATDTETAILPATVYVQYDALRLELN